MIYLLRLCFVLVSVFYGVSSQATTVMANTEFQLELSDGQVIWVHTAGNAHSQWLETTSGQVIVKRSGYWYEGFLDDGVAVSNGIALSKKTVLVKEAVSTKEAVLIKEVASMKSIEARAALSTSYSSSSVLASAQAAPVFSSSAPYQQPLLLLRVSFSNQDFHYPLSSFQSLIFAGSDSDLGSVAQYYRENSYDKFNIHPAIETHGANSDGVIDISLPYAHPNFGANYGKASQDLARDAVNKASEYIDFKYYDSNGDGQLAPRELGIVIMVAGYENAYGGAGATEPNVWAHKTEFAGVISGGVRLSSYAMFGERHQGHLATIGIISHEMGHLLFSLPDLYDRQGDSNGIGRWGLMGLGSWNSNNAESGSSPAHMLAWSKVKAGFLQPEDVEGDQLDFSLLPSTKGDEAMRIWLDPFKHGEHFLLEYRTQTGFDRGLPGEGLLISHVDDWVGYGVVGAQNDVAEHKLVDIEEADGRSDLDMQQNRGDRLDVFNDAYGQNYFGSSSLPASLNYKGDSSGVEVSQIEVSEVTKGRISLPYAKLGDNLGYDDGGIGVSWGSADSESLVAFPVDSNMPFLHGVDIFSHVNSSVVVSVFSNLEDGEVSNALLVSSVKAITPGWNRISFSQRVSVEGFERVFLQISVEGSNSRAFTIDTSGVVSKQSFVKSNGTYQVANFDFNQRLLVANQEAEFSYQVPEKLPLKTDATKSKAGGNMNAFFIMMLLTIFVLSSKKRMKMEGFK